MQECKVINERVLCVTPDALYVSRGSRVFYSDDHGITWRLWVSLPVSFWQRIAMRIPILSRLLRLAIHHFVLLDDKALIIVNKSSFLIEANVPHYLGPIKGSRPLTICVANGKAYYGEYRDNPEKSRVHIYELDPAGRLWMQVAAIHGVRHIHGVYYDPYSDAFWFTTGDLDSESAIWCSQDNFNSYRKVVGGAQQFRAIQLLFTHDYVYFGSDTPNETNSIYRMSRLGENIQNLCDVGGSVFYGSCVGDKIFFSTAVEPSRVNHSKYVQLWRSDDGQNFKKIFEVKKDLLSKKYFQYGQMLFPSGSGDDENIYCILQSTIHHGKTLKLLASEDGRFKLPYDLP